MRQKSQIYETALGSVECSVEGSGPSLLVLHGSPGGFDQSLTVVHGLEIANLTIVAPSRPGYLRTPLLSGATPSQQADLYAALLDGLGIKETLVMAISGGGPSAIEFALRHPLRCRGLILLSALTTACDEKESLKKLPLLERISSRLVNQRARSDRVLKLLLGLMAPDPQQKKLHELTASSLLLSSRKAGYLNDMEQYRQVEWSAKGIETPTLVIHGDKDRDIPLQDALPFAEQLPHGTFLPIEGADHSQTLLDPRTSRAVDDYLKTTLSRQP